MTPSLKIPTLSEARALLEAAARREGGRWVGHSRRTGEAARLLAQAHPSLDPEAAETLGLLHDIGRGEAPGSFRHTLEGYRLLKGRGWDDAARVCLTHSFPAKDFSQLDAAEDLTEEDRRFVRKFIEPCEDTDYDRLIQLCDALAQAAGFCLLEKRFVDIALRYAPSPASFAKWRAVLELRDAFSRAIGRSVYDLLPGIVENTFRLTKPTAD
ncbi:MAG: HD domain-containing protein [Candidatus Sumerlaeota bacterium]|nr:HD domain-containing protein [Candidatus Sumerlaeota bacterium]